MSLSAIEPAAGGNQAPPPTPCNAKSSERAPRRPVPPVSTYHDDQAGALLRVPSQALRGYREDDLEVRGGVRLSSDVRGRGG